MKKKSVVPFWIYLTFILISSHSYAAPVPDTGQTKCYDVSGNEIPCPSPGQDLYGQDANYSINPMSYIKLDSNGNALPDSATSWAMVRDNVTGLIWEVKTNKDGIQNYNDPHDAENTYTWHDPSDTYPGTPGDGTDTEDFIKALNDANYGGYSDWRLPSKKELTSIIDYSIPDPGPTIDTRYFPNTMTSWQGYWTSTTFVDQASYAFFVYFNNGDPGCFLKEHSRYVRAVRGQKFFSDFIDNGNGTVTDTSSGLIWQQETPDNTMTWQNALTYCEEISLAGFTDWRLPTIKELRSLADYSRDYPSINTTFFPDTASSLYWSSTTDATAKAKAWIFYFNFGFGGDNSKLDKFYVRAVRSVNSVPVTTGDVNDDNEITLEDAIVTLQILAGIIPESTVDLTADVDEDGTIGIAEALYSLQVVGGVRVP